MTTPPGAAPWAGAWVAERLDIGIEDGGGAIPVRDLVGLALRRNPRRAHLLVSPVLGKHVPVRPSAAVAAGRALGGLVAERLGGTPVGFVLGFAETATGLGHLVADGLGAPYLHSTRRAVPGRPAAAAFEEAHSHATAHLLAPADPGLLDAPGAVVLVDDELSTGATALGTIEALQRRRPRDRYVLAGLVDVRDEVDRQRAADAARRLRCRIDVVALGTGRVRLPPDVLARGAVVAAGLAPSPVLERSASRPERVAVPMPRVEGGRHGFTDDDRHDWRSVLPEAVAALAAVLPRTGRVHVLGTEEFMAWPLAVALGLERALPEAAVTSSATTRSPVAAVDEPGYAVRDAVAFPAHDAPTDGPGERYAYNLASLASDALVVMTDRAGAAPALAGLLEVVGGTAGRVVVAEAAR